MCSAFYLSGPVPKCHHPGKVIWTREKGIASLIKAYNVFSKNSPAL